jgi:predicted PurR-regulated permease PerM
MQTLISDLKSIIRTLWKTILVIILTFYLLYSFADIKQGIMDGWMNK